MADNLAPSVNVTLTAEDQGVAAAIRALGQELGNLKKKSDDVDKSTKKLGLSFKTLAQESLSALKLRIANIPGLGNFGSALALRAYEPIGKELEQGAEALETKFGAAALAIGGTAAAVVALGVAAAAVDDHMMHLARSITNTSFATGLSVRQVQEYTEVAKEMDVDTGTLQMALARLNTQLGEYVVLGSKSGSSSQMLTRVLSEFGVQMKTAEGNARPLNDVLADFYDALQKIPDQATRTEAELTAFGTRGRVLAQIFEEARANGVSFRDMLKSVDASGNVMADSQVANLIRSEQEWEHLKGIVRGFFTELGADVAEATLSWRGFERAIATTVLALGTTIPGKDADALVNKLLPLPGGAVPGATGGAGSASFLALQQIAQTNEQLAERVAVLKTGGENQEKLKEAEASYAAAVKSHNDALVKAYGTEIASLKEIIALEAGKRKGAAEGGALDAANKAALALALKQQQDLLEIAKAGMAEREEVEKGEYERGLISIAQYYGDRKQAVQDGTAQEIAALQKEREQLVQSADLAGNRALEARTGAAKTPADKQRLAAEADKFNAQQLEALARIDELDTRITVAQMNSRKELSALDNEQYRAELEHKQKILDMEEKIGLASERQFSDRATGTGEGVERLQDERDAIQIRLNDHLISQKQSEKEIKSLLEGQLPALRQKAQLELESAQATGDEDKISQAQQAIMQIQQIGDAMNRTATIVKNVKATMTQDFQQLFMSLASGTKTAGQAFAEFGLTVVHQLEAIVAQMLSTMLVTEIFNALGIGGNEAQVAKKVATNDQMIVSDAGAAGAAAFASAMAALPFPANLAAAPAAMAAAIAEVMSNLALGSAAKGAVLPSDMLIQAHAEEMILPKHISRGLTDMIGSAELGTTPEHVRPEDFGVSRLELPESISYGDRSSTINNEIHLHHTGPDALEVLRGQLVPELKKSFRNGQLDFIAP